MTRLLALLLCTVAMLTLAASPIAHTAERTVCVESTSVSHLGDEGGDPSDPGNSGKNVQHQHGGCHGHHFASLSGDEAIGEHLLLAAALPSFHAAVLHGATVDPALRPPQA
jgi:hypothetical protein